MTRDLFALDHQLHTNLPPRHSSRMTPETGEQQQQAPTSNRFSRRLSSVPRDLRNSFENVSSRLSFSNASRHASSGHRKTLSVLETDSASHVKSHEGLNGAGPRRPSSSMGMPAAASSHSDPFTAGPPQRSTSAMSNSDAASIHSSTGSIGPTSGRWFERLRRNSNRTVSREIDTALEKANEAAAHRSHNPFLRKRSIASVVSVTAYHEPGRKILGATPAQAAEMGGVASSASSLLPASFISESRDVEVPYVVDACVAYLLQHDAISMPGLFRVSGSNAACRALAEYFSHFSNEAARIPLNEIVLPGDQVLSVHDVASTLKKYLTLLPGGLFGESVFMELQELSEEEPGQRSARHIAEALTEMTDPLKLAICQIQLGLLATIAERTVTLRAESAQAEHEVGYMTGKTLGIVFAPACLGATAPGHSMQSTPSTTGRMSNDMRRSSTSQSDYSFKSDASTQIEEAVLQAKQAGKVVEMLIAHWQEVVPLLDQLTGSDALGQQRPRSSRSSMDYVRRGHVDSDIARPLDTIMDSSPLKLPPPKDARRNEHARNMSVDTVTQGCTCDKAKHRESAMVKGLEVKLAASEQQRSQALEQIATLELQVQALQRELALGKLQVHEGPSVSTDAREG
ncbi:hypothetical protein BCR37DRAFT_389535 [Protomyces lactucae-debilis]|uniref:Rho-GAP domain-containing protein n=1 Tax=Protomyces lactucae-debilis TaxID=2754530 RepID=A0A1Y2EZB8_PROLT|nr:uncharacterized protein BCR37DRAFT_389535 [Protomyces lactucae-debilis]ORY76085.1 hypothetical protein BCR37DRAFT_389535 [Protomyces lactucae-debilis]